MTERDRDELLIQERKIQSFLMNHMIDGTHQEIRMMMNEIDKIIDDVDRGKITNMNTHVTIRWKYKKDLPSWLQQDVKKDEMDIYYVFKDLARMLNDMKEMMNKVFHATYIDKNDNGGNYY